MGSQKGMFWIVVVMKTLERKSQWRNFTKILNYIFKTYLYTPLVVIYFTGSLVIQYRKSFGWTFKFIRHQSLILLLRLWKRSKSQKILAMIFLTDFMFSQISLTLGIIHWISTEVKYSSKLTFLTFWYAHVGFSENFVYLLNSWSHSRIV